MDALRHDDDLEEFLKSIDEMIRVMSPNKHWDSFRVTASKVVSLGTILVLQRELVKRAWVITMCPVSPTHGFVDFLAMRGISYALLAADEDLINRAKAKVLDLEPGEREFTLAISPSVSWSTLAHLRGVMISHAFLMEEDPMSCLEVLKRHVDFRFSKV